MNVSPQTTLKRNGEPAFFMCSECKMGGSDELSQQWYGDSRCIHCQGERYRIDAFTAEDFSKLSFMSKSILRDSRTDCIPNTRAFRESPVVITKDFVADVLLDRARDIELERSFKDSKYFEIPHAMVNHLRVDAHRLNYPHEEQA